MVSLKFPEPLALTLVKGYSLYIDENDYSRYEYDLNRLFGMGNIKYKDGFLSVTQTGKEHYKKIKEIENYRGNDEIK